MRVNLILLNFSLIFVLTSTKSLKTNTQIPKCKVVDAFLNPGFYNVGQQAKDGFCNEWIIGGIVEPSKIQISYEDLQIKCTENDMFVIFTEDRKDVLMDYCLSIRKRNEPEKFIIAEGKYIHLRLSTDSSRLVGVRFNFTEPTNDDANENLIENTDVPILSVPITIRVNTATIPMTTIPITTSNILTEPVIQSTTENSITSATVAIQDATPTTKIPSTDTPDISECPSEPIIFRDNEGEIEFSNVLKNNTKFDCYWIIQAAPLQRIRLEISSLSLPKSNSSTRDCNEDYLAISSYYKQNQYYRICDQRKALRLLTTYNVVLINFLSSTFSGDLKIGFKLTYKMIGGIVGPGRQTTTRSSLPLVTNPYILQDPKCGQPNKKPLEMNLRIVGGKEAVPNSFPWQVLMTDGSIICGATLIDRSWILTAAHCVEGTPARLLRVTLGLHNRFMVEQSKIVRNISEVHMSPKYVGRYNQWDSDIALLKIKEPIEYTNEISPICLPSQNKNPAPIGTDAIVSGWGYTLGTGSPIALRQTTVTVNKVEHCGAASENMLCAGNIYPEIRDACQVGPLSGLFIEDPEILWLTFFLFFKGDSGGPLVVKNDDESYVLAGIVSWGYDCNGAGIYTKVSNYIDWINSVVAKADKADVTLS